MQFKIIVMVLIFTVALFASDETLNSEKVIHLMKIIFFGLLTLFSMFKIEQNAGALTYNTNRLNRGKGTFLNTITTAIMTPIWIMVFFFCVTVLNGEKSVSDIMLDIYNQLTPLGIILKEWLYTK